MLSLTNELFNDDIAIINLALIEKCSWVKTFNHQTGKYIMADEKKNKDFSLEEEKELIKSRRTALRKILIGGGVVTSAHFLPHKWMKPVVDHIIVPAYALPSNETQTSTQAPTSTTQPTTGAPSTASPTVT